MVFPALLVKHQILKEIKLEPVDERCFCLWHLKMPMFLALVIIFSVKIIKEVINTMHLKIKDNLFGDGQTSSRTIKYFMDST